MFRSIDGRDGFAPMTPTLPDHFVYGNLGPINTLVRQATAAQLQPKKDVSAMTPGEIDTLLPSLSLVAQGKTKSLYEHPDKPDVLLMKSRDSITGGDGAVKAEMPGKGAISTAVTQHIYKRLAQKGVRTHLVGQVSPTVLEVKKAAKHLPGEFIFRNYSWGSYAKKQGNKGAPLEPPVFEVFYKNDVFDTGGNKISDPEVRQDADGKFARHPDGRPVLVKPGTDEVIEYTFENVKTPSGQVVDRENFLADIDLMEQRGQEIKEMTLRVGAEIKTFFEECGMTSIDGKIEFGLDEKGNLMLIDVFDFDSGRQGINAQFEEKKLVAIDQVDKDKFRARGKDPAKKGEPVSTEEADALVMNDYRLGMRLIENREKFEQIEAMIKSGKCLWKSTELETAKNGDGKINVFVKEGDGLAMYVCKPGCFERIEIVGEAGERATFSDEELQDMTPDQEAWENIGRVGYPEGSDGNTPGATFSFVRLKKFGQITFGWTGAHTNPTEPNGAFTVKDTIAVVK